jgi:hypothetical protein
MSDGKNGDPTGFVEAEVEVIGTVLSPAAVNALMSFAGERGISLGGGVDSASDLREDDKRSKYATALDLVRAVSSHINKEKFGDQMKTYYYSFADVSFSVKAINQELGQTLDSTGLTVWRAAEHLCDYIGKNQAFFRGKVVFELGSGLGICSILLDKLGICKRILVSDGDDKAVALLSENLKHCNCSEKITPHKVIWGDHEAFLKEHTDISLMIAADVLYMPEHVPAFSSVVLDVMKLAAKAKSRDLGEEAQPVALFLAYAQRHVSLDTIVEEFKRVGLQVSNVEDGTEPILYCVLDIS